MRSVINLGLDLAAGLAACTVKLNRWRAIGQFASVGVEVLALGHEGLPGICRRDRSSGLRIRNIQHRARLDQVDVAANECFGISSQHGHQHLVQRHAGRLDLRCNQAGIVARPDSDLACSGRALGRRWPERCRLCAVSRPVVLTWGVLPGGQGGYGQRFARKHRCRRDQWSAIGTQIGRVKQHRVVAGDASGSPFSLQNQVYEWLIDRTGAAQAQIWSAVWPPL